MHTVLDMGLGQTSLSAEKGTSAINVERSLPTPTAFSELISNASLGGNPTQSSSSVQLSPDIFDSLFKQYMTSEDVDVRSAFDQCKARRYLESVYFNFTTETGGLCRSFFFFSTTRSLFSRPFRVCASVKLLEAKKGIFWFCLRTFSTFTTCSEGLQWHYMIWLKTWTKSNNAQFYFRFSASCALLHSLSFSLSLSVYPSLNLSLALSCFTSTFYNSTRLIFFLFSSPTSFSSIL